MKVHVLYYLLPEHIRRRVFALITSSVVFSPTTSPKLAESIAWCGII